MNYLKMSIHGIFFFVLFSSFCFLIHIPQRLKVIHSYILKKIDIQLAKEYTQDKRQKH